MRLSREEAEKNREKVVQAAGRKFRERGYEGIGVVGLMEAAGLTHGGFYKQFEDKEALIVEATALALASNAGQWHDVMAKAPGDPVKALRRWYLSKEHLKRVGDGCAFAALAAEAPRHNSDLRRTFEQALETSISSLTAEIKGKKGAEARGEAIRTLAQMIGSLMLARAINSQNLAEEILKSGQSG